MQYRATAGVLQYYDSKGLAELMALTRLFHLYSHKVTIDIRPLHVSPTQLHHMFILHYSLFISIQFPGFRSFQSEIIAALTQNTAVERSV